MWLGESGHALDLHGAVLELILVILLEEHSADPAGDAVLVGACNAGSVVVTADILLADRCLKAGAAAVLAPNGKPFTTSSIGSAVAVRAIMADLRAGGDRVGGPPPFAKEDRSRFLSALDAALVRVKRSAG